MKKEYLIRALPFLSAILAWLAYPPAEWSFLAWLAYVPLVFYIAEISKDTGFFKRRFIFITKSGLQAFLPVYLGGILFFILGLIWLRHVSWAGLFVIPIVMSLYWVVFAAAGYFIMRAFSAGYAAFLMPACWVFIECLRSFILTGFPWLFAGHTQYRWIPFIQISDITGVYGISFIILFTNVVIFMLVNEFLRNWKQGVPKVSLRTIAKQSHITNEIATATCGDLAMTEGAFHKSLVIKERLRVSSKTVVLVIIATGLFAVTLLYGTGRLNGLTVKEGPVIGIVQGNIEQSLKVDQSNAEDIYYKHFDLTTELLKSEPRPDLVVWAETMFPLMVGLDEEYLKILKDTVFLCGAPMLIGVLTVTPSQNEGREYDIFNSAYYLDANGELIDRYDKSHLVPISEYIPLKDNVVFKGIIRAIVRALSELKEVYGMLEGDSLEPFLLKVKREGSQAADYTGAVRVPLPEGRDELQPSIVGSNSLPLKLPHYKYGVLICYESIFPELARESVRRGADFIINISNDGWFKNSSELDQILAISAFRAVENKITFVRATNTGISAIIQPSGRIDAFKDKDGRAKEIEGIWATQLVISGQKGTVYTRWGDYFPYLCLLMIGAIIILKYLKILDKAC